MFAFNYDRFLPDIFQATYKCYSVSMLPDERQDLEKGGKIIMPPSALHTLTRLNTTYPMLFKLTNQDKNRFTHSGVLEFIAEEGKVYLPYWMMRNLLLDEGTMLHVQSVSLPVATFSKFQPQSVDFLDIHNPKAVLENGLRNFACLTTGDVIAINYNNKVYELSVLETRPGDAVSIIECDMNVEFEAPIGYQESLKNKQQQQQLKDSDQHNLDSQMLMNDDQLMEDHAKHIALFQGKGNRLDGKPPKDQDSSSGSNQIRRKEIKYGQPDYDYQIGLLKFCRINRSIKKTNASKDGGNNGSNGDDNQPFKPFLGEGQTLFNKKKNTNNNNPSI